MIHCQTDASVLPVANRFDAILFDADNTLFDYSAGEAAAFTALCLEVGIPSDAATLRQYTEINRAYWVRLEAGKISPEELRVRRFEELFHRLGVTVPDLEEVSEYYLARLAESALLFEGAKEIVFELSQSHALALVSNGLSVVQRPRFARSGLLPAFKHVAISEEIGFAKPDLRVFQHTLQALGNPVVERVLMVGDSLTADIRGANRAGICSCWLQQPGHELVEDIRPTHTIQDIRELRKLLTVDEVQDRT